jgi:hypothetical protein
MQRLTISGEGPMKKSGITEMPWKIIESCWACPGLMA